MRARRAGQRVSCVAAKPTPHRGRRGVMRGQPGPLAPFPRSICETARAGLNFVWSFSARVWARRPTLPPGYAQSLDAEAPDGSDVVAVGPAQPGRGQARGRNGLLDLSTQAQWAQHGALHWALERCVSQQWPGRRQQHSVAPAMPLLCPGSTWSLFAASRGRCGSSGPRWTLLGFLSDKGGNLFSGRASRGPRSVRR